MVGYFTSQCNHVGYFESRVYVGYFESEKM